MNTTEGVTQSNQVSENNSHETKKGSRSFKVKLEKNGPQYGRYNGDSPYQAANKALSEIIRTRVKNNQSADTDINFFLIESTKGSGKKEHQYVGKRTKLDNPVSYAVNNGQMITKEYKNILRKVKKAEINQTGGTNQEQPTQEQPKQEQPKQEQEQPKQEQPKQEQPKQEQLTQEQPSQNSKST